MRILAYRYRDPILEPESTLEDWGWTVDRTYQDLRLGTQPLISRPQLQQLLRDCQTEPATYLLIRRLEELGDSGSEIRDRLIELELRGLQVIVTQAGQETLITPSEAAVASLEWLETQQQQYRSQQIQAGHARNRIKALPPPGKAPYGYRRGKDRYIVDRSTAPVVQDFFNHFLLYGSLRGAVRYLAKKYGKKISVSTGQRWLTSPVYRGDLEYQTGDVILNTHTAILSRDEAAQVDRLLRRNRQLPPRTASAPRSLAGLTRCSQCQSPMTVSRVTAVGNDREYLYLRPTHCSQRKPCRAIPYQQVLERTIQAICQELPLAVAQIQLPDRLTQIKQGIQQTIANQETVLSQLPELVQTGILDAETAALRAYQVRTELAKLQGQLAQMPPISLQAIARTIALPQFWFDLSEAERRFYFREFIQQIQVNPQNEPFQLQLVFIF